MIYPLTTVPPGPGQDRLVEVGSVTVDTAGALRKAGQGVLHYYHECYHYYCQALVPNPLSPNPLGPATTQSNPVQRPNKFQGDWG